MMEPRFFDFKSDEELENLKEDRPNWSMEAIASTRDQEIKRTKPLVTVAVYQIQATHPQWSFNPQQDR
jgi:hypothetical protein